MKRSVFRRALPFLLCVCTCFLLPSCAAAEGVMSRLGFDMHNYRGEKTLSTHDPDSETAATLAALIRPLIVNTPLLSSFSGAAEAADVCRDAILNHMLEDGYARYAGNPTLLSIAAESYPQLQINVLIPADDFEAVVYATFGGSEKITNRSSDLFRYLEKIDAYTTAVSLQPTAVEITVIRCEETERTYRLYFSNTLDEVTSPEYFALFIKRDDGTLYIRELSEAKN